MKNHLQKLKMKIIECPKCRHKQKVRSKKSICSICLWPMNKEYNSKKNYKKIKNIHEISEKGLTELEDMENNIHQSMKE